MTTHITNSSKEVLSKFEASLLDITPLQRDRLNFIGSLNYSSFSGAGIVKELVNLKEYWVSLILAGQPLKLISQTQYHEFITWRRLFQVKNYLSKVRYAQILIETKCPVKLKNILKTKKWNQTKTEVLKQSEVRKYLAQDQLIQIRRNIKMVNIEWNKL